MKVSIRPAVTADRHEIAAASRDTWEEHRTRQPYAFPENGWEMLLKRDHAHAFLSGEGYPIGESGNLFVAEADGVIVGYVLLSWHLRDDAPDAHNGSIVDIWVDPKWRKKGVGHNLVSFAKEMAETANWDNLYAQVWAGAPSSDLFETAGFAPAHVTWRYGPDRPAALIEPRAKKNNLADAAWKWAVAIVLIGLFITIMTQA
ncbi:GNAT family N-acetyltransferase [Gymnodinialimonas sp. 57CJ19]|uniref:GNAT family N-acetyltransferase n=1 Tax=Gymnodinialimonas sp. 57CJ19 TaxID=3138498 RepID=UPI0031344055